MSVIILKDIEIIAADGTIVDRWEAATTTGTRDIAASVIRRGHRDVTIRQHGFFGPEDIARVTRDSKGGPAIELIY